MFGIGKCIVVVAVVVAAASALSLLSGCSSAPAVKKQEYAVLLKDRTYEYELPVVWKAIEKVFKDYKITERDPEKVDDLELKRLDERSISTDWIYGQSRDKYQEYVVNSFPRKKYLQTRLKYKITAKKTMGGTAVHVDMSEEIEKLDKQGKSAGYEKAAESDSSRANELLDKINMAILSA
jgi:outer membrane murein-binding lipoprotein Lpp